MSEENTTSSEQPQQIQVQAVLQDNEARTTYANFYNFRNTPAEVIMEVGLQILNPPQQQGGNAQMLIKLTDRIVMNYQTTKRLAQSLQQLVRWYEQQYGEINLGQPKK